MLPEYYSGKQKIIIEPLRSVKPHLVARMIFRIAGNQNFTRPTFTNGQDRLVSDNDDDDHVSVMQEIFLFLLVQ